MKKLYLSLKNEETGWSFQNKYILVIQASYIIQTLYR